SELPTNASRSGGFNVPPRWNGAESRTSRWLESALALDRGPCPVRASRSDGRAGPRWKWRLHRQQETRDHRNRRRRAFRQPREKPRCQLAHRWHPPRRGPSGNSHISPVALSFQTDSGGSPTRSSTKCGLATSKVLAAVSLRGGGCSSVGSAFAAATAAST